MVIDGFFYKATVKLVLQFVSITKTWFLYLPHLSLTEGYRSIMSCSESITEGEKISIYH